MPEKKQEFWLVAKTALLNRRMSVADLARRIRRPRPTVSSVIHGDDRFPRVLVQVKEELGL
jgi:plasmid maintenance system antidote protein VapI